MTTPVELRSRRGIEVEGRLELESTAHSIALVAEGDRISVRAESLRALRGFASGGFKSFRARLPNWMSSLDLGFEVWVGRWLIARLGPHAQPGLASALLNLSGFELFPWNLVRARFGRSR